MVESLLFIEAGAGASKKRTGSATLHMVGVQVFREVKLVGLGRYRYCIFKIKPFAKIY